MAVTLQLAKETYLKMKLLQEPTPTNEPHSTRRTHFRYSLIPATYDPFGFSSSNLQPISNLFFSFHEIQWNLKDDDGGIANFVLKNFEYLSVSSGSLKMLYCIKLWMSFSSKMNFFKLKKSIPYFMSSQTSSISFTNSKLEILNCKIFCQTKFIQGFGIIRFFKILPCPTRKVFVSGSGVDPCSSCSSTRR